MSTSLFKLTEKRNKALYFWVTNAKKNMTISVVNHKGGTGKTTTTISLGSALAALGQKVLLVDFDAQGSLTYSLGIDNKVPTVADLILNDSTFNEVVVEREGVDVLPANESLADVELSMAKLDERFYHLKNALLVASGYDFILIDCPPSLSLLTINALVASDQIIVPMQLDVLALRGFDSLTATIKNVRPLDPALDVLGILPVMVDSRKSIHQEIIAHLKTNYETRIFKNPIHSCVKTAEAPSFGKSVIRYAPSSSTAQDYCNLAEEVLEIVALRKESLSMIEQ